MARHTWWQRNVDSVRTSARTARRGRPGPRLFVELLEDRTLLAGGVTALPSAVTDHLSSDLVGLAQQTLGIATASAAAAAVRSGDLVASSQDLFQFDSAGRVAVEITAADVTRLQPALQQLDFQVSAALPQQHLLEGYLPTTSLVAAAGLSAQGLLGIMPSYKPMTSAGLVDSQGDNVLEADRVRATAPGNYDGTGVKVGVLSDSYNKLGGAAADIASGDLPAGGVTVLEEDPFAGEDEGRAMLQIVHDLAPGAALGFSTAFNGAADFAQQIRDLADPAKFGAKVIVDDITYLNEPYYQDGIIAQAVNDVVTNNGVSYFSAAGNFQDQAWESTAVSFTSTTLLSISPSPQSYYDFGGGVVRQPITISGGFQAGFQWDQPFYTASGVTTNLDIYYLNHITGAIIARATTDNISTQTPLELPPGLRGSGTFDIVIRLTAGTTPGRIKWVNFGTNSFGPATISFATHSPTITPHAGAANAMAVAASAFFDQRNPESFTSLGPTTILFSPTGTPIPTVTRAKPDLTATDGVSTTFFGGFSSGVGFTFFGTSAAAPHAAAVAALIKQANPAFTPADIYSALKTTADPNIGAVPNVNLVGAGLIDAYKAIYGGPTALVANASTGVTDGGEAGVLGNYWEVYNSFSGRTRVINDAGNAAHGSYYVGMDSHLPSGFSYSTRFATLSEAILHVNATNTANVMLTFNQKEFSDPDNAMPATFTGHNNSDGVAFSVDGTNWYRLVTLTGANSTNSYQLNTFNLSTIAAGLALTLGADVRIKFQHYNSAADGTGQITTRGFAFDDVAVALTPTQTYVDDTWGTDGSVANQAPNHNPIGAALVFGFNAFATIQGGIDAVGNGGSVLVYGGTYNAAVDVNKALAGVRLDTNSTVSAETLVTVGGAVTVGSSVTVTLNSAGLTFGSTIDDAAASTDSLTAVTSNAALQMLFNGAVGVGTPLSGLTVDDAGAGDGASGLIAGAGTTFTKKGAGSFTLSNGANSYTGVTDLQAGTLLVTGTISSNVSLDGGTLGGTGTVGNITATASGGTVSPGLSPGVLSGGAITWNSFTTFRVEIGGANPGNGSGFYDQLVAAGAVSLGNAALNVSAFGGFLPAPGQSFTILKNNSGTAVSGTFAGLIEGAQVSANFLGSGLPATITYKGGASGHDVVINVAPSGAFVSADGKLNVLGTNGNDNIIVTYLNGHFNVQINGRSFAFVTGTGAGQVNPMTGRVIIYGFDTMPGGTDNITMSGTFPAEIHAGNGTTVVHGGDGGNVVYGGTLTNSRLTAYAGAGNDVLMGGAGTATLTGGRGHSILIGGTVSGYSYAQLVMLAANWWMPATGKSAAELSLEAGLPGAINAGVADTLTAGMGATWGLGTAASFAGGWASPHKKTVL